MAIRTVPPLPAGLDWIDLPITIEHGVAEHYRGVFTAQPGLYAVGQLFLHSLTSALIGGVGRDAEHIARHIAARGRLPSFRRRSRPTASRTAGSRSQVHPDSLPATVQKEGPEAAGQGGEHDD